MGLLKGGDIHQDPDAVKSGRSLVFTFPGEKVKG
jgi:hypothetical protein